MIKCDERQVKEMTNNTITSITQLKKEVFFLEKWRFKVEFDNGEVHDVTVTADVERAELPLV